MPEPTNEAHGIKIVSEAYRRWAKMGDVPITIHPQDAYIAMGGLQPLTRHLEIDERMKKVFEKVGRIIQENDMRQSRDLHARGNGMGFRA